MLNASREYRFTVRLRPSVLQRSSRGFFAAGSGQVASRSSCSIHSNDAVKSGMLHVRAVVKSRMIHGQAYFTASSPSVRAPSSFASLQAPSEHYYLRLKVDMLSGSPMAAALGQRRMCWSVISVGRGVGDDVGDSVRDSSRCRRRCRRRCGSVVGACVRRRRNCRRLRRGRCQSVRL